MDGAAVHPLRRRGVGVGRVANHRVGCGAGMTGFGSKQLFGITTKPSPCPSGGGDDPPNNSPPRMRRGPVERSETGGWCERGTVEMTDFAAIAFLESQPNPPLAPPVEGMIRPSTPLVG